MTLHVQPSAASDAEALTSLVERNLEMPAPARDAAVAALLGAGGAAALDEQCLVCRDTRGTTRGAACLRAVVLARSAVDVEWLVVDPDFDDGFAYTAASLASLLAGIVFILALVVALNTRTERPQDVF